MNHFAKKAGQLVVPLTLGIVVFALVYRNLDLEQLLHIIRQDVKIEWILFSLFFGFISNVIRGHRWQMMLQAIGQKPKLSNTTYAVFSLYFMNALIPRLGEIYRCQLLQKYEKIPIAQSLGTVFSERIWDMISVSLIFATGIALEFHVYHDFFTQQLQLSFWIEQLKSFSKYLPIIILVVVAIGLIIARKYRFSQRFRTFGANLAEGVRSIKKLTNKPLFFIETLLIWLCYFYQFYVCLFAFDFTSGLTLLNGLTLYIMGSLGVLIPVPQGIGTWHFMIIGTLAIFGVSSIEAGAFALLVHTTQTLLLILLGFLSIILLPLTNKEI